MFTWQGPEGLIFPGYLRRAPAAPTQSVPASNAHGIFYPCVHGHGREPVQPTRPPISRITYAGPDCFRLRQDAGQIRQPSTRRPLVLDRPSRHEYSKGMTALDGLMAEVASGKKLRIAGLMSGTSIDGVDVAVVDIRDARVRLVAFDVFPYPATLRTSILELCHPDTARVDRICHFNHLLGEVFAEAVIKLCRRKHIDPSSIDLIGSHGQTIWHQPQGGRYQGRMIRSTLQIGEPSVIAQRTGITTVADFRPRDMAAGGQGRRWCPTATTFSFAMRRAAGPSRTSAGSPMSPSCPGPTSRRHHRLRHRPGQHGDRRRDAPGQPMENVTTIAAGRRGQRQGRRAAPARDAQASFPATQARPSRPAGRNSGQSYCDWLYRQPGRGSWRPEDMLATVTAFTARTIADAYLRFLPRMPDEMILAAAAPTTGRWCACCSRS